MSSVDQSLHGFADLFCLYHDELDEDVARAEAATWTRERGWDSNMGATRNDVLSGRSVSNVVIRVNNGEGRQSRLFAALRGMDDAFRFVNPVTRGGERIPAKLVRLAGHVEAHGRLDSGEHGGAVIPRLVHRGVPDGDADHKRDLFANVQRVPADSWDRCHFLTLGAAEALTRHELQAGIVVACVPVIADPDELHFATRATASRRYYRIGPRDLAATLARIPEVVAELDRSCALIAIAPEATLTPGLLEGWQRALRARRGSRLRWVLAGTGDFSGPNGRPDNTAVLLDGRTGAVIGRQHKLYPFTFSAELLQRWGLTTLLGDPPLAEDLTATPRRLTVFDIGGIRMAILICEDLNKPLDLGNVVRDLGISHLLVPVFSRPIKSHRWEQTAAGVHVRETGTTVVVSNSLVMATIQKTPNPGTSLVVTPDGKALTGQAADPSHPACFRLRPDGSAERL